jgi:nucleoside phosphorylase
VLPSQWRYEASDIETMSFNQTDIENLPCAVIVTAIADEFRAVSSFLSSISRIRHPSGTIYRQGIFGEGSKAWRIIVCEIGAGNTGAAMEGERAIAFFNPAVLAFVGVAGGLKDVRIGDVVAATKVYGYEAGKAKEQFQTRPEVFRSSYGLEQEARAAVSDNTWAARSKYELEQPPKAIVGPIAAGEKVVASTYSEAWQLIRNSYGDALAVEMEGAGILKAGHANQHVKTIVVRGISDLVDKKEEADAAGSQEIAADRASAFMFEILSNLNNDANLVGRESMMTAPQRSLNQGESVNEAEMLERAKALIPLGRNSNETGLSLIVVGGPRQQIIRPSELEDPSLPLAIKKEARYGNAALFDDDQGTKSRIVGHSLIVEQSDAAIYLDEQGTVRINVPSRSDSSRNAGWLPMIIEEDIVSRLTRELHFASWLLDHIDPQHRLSDVILLVVLSGANYLGWRTQAEHQASPNQASIGARAMMHGEAPVIVQLSPAQRKRVALMLDTQSIVQDLVTLLRREMR